MKILQTNGLLQDLRKRNPQSRPLIGDIACLKGGRIVARYQLKFSDGTTAWAVRDYALDRDPPELLAGATPKDWGRWITEEIERGQGRYRELGPRDFVAAAELEHADFHQQFPHTAAFLKIPRPPSRSPLFPVGRVHYPAQWSGVEWRRLLEQHDGGDFGVYGKSDGVPLSDEEEWALAEQEVRIQNKFAITTKSGPIRSRYHLPSSRIVTVLTVLSPGGARTLMTADQADANLAGHP